MPLPEPGAIRHADPDDLAQYRAAIARAAKTIGARADDPPALQLDFLQDATAAVRRVDGQWNVAKTRRSLRLAGKRRRQTYEAEMLEHEWSQRARYEMHPIDWPTPAIYYAPQLAWPSDSPWAALFLEAGYQHIKPDSDRRQFYFDLLCLLSSTNGKEPTT